MIKLDALTKYYNKNARGILDVSLEIKEGEIFGFIGPNGAGKSTTVRTILNLIFPTSGTGEVDGLDIVKDTVEIRKFVGYIPGEVHLYGDMIVEDFLKYAAGYNGDIDEAYYKELVEELQIDTSRKMDDLSQGNKKKVAIVQALLSKPKLLILDEPTSGLDPLIKNTFFNILRKEKERGVTIFFSSHILSEVQELCDRVGIIKEGKLIKVESISEILKTRAKKVSIKTDDELPKSKNIVNLETVNGYHTFVYTGKIETLLKTIQTLKIEDLTISDPPLEEVFMHYYKKEDNDEASH